MLVAAADCRHLPETTGTYPRFYRHLYFSMPMFAEVQLRLTGLMICAGSCRRLPAFAWEFRHLSYYICQYLMDIYNADTDTYRRRPAFTRDCRHLPECDVVFPRRVEIKRSHHLCQYMPEYECLCQRMPVVGGKSCTSWPNSPTKTITVYSKIFL